MNKEIILLVDDDITVLNSLRVLLLNSNGDYIIEVAESGEEALEIYEDLKKEGLEISLIISDYIMPTMKGDELLVRLHTVSPKTIKIMLTGQSDLRGVKRAINEANLYRFLEKPFHNADMVLTIKSALFAIHQDQELERRNKELEATNAHLEQLVAERTRELVEKNNLLEKLSITDRLTGLHNRLKLDQVIDEEYARCKQGSNSFAIILLDIDKFKSINDTYGHSVGDLVLKEFAKILSSGIREIDTVGRWGGEEFLIICRDTDQSSVIALAESLRSTISNHDFPVVQNRTSSFGVSVFTKGDTIAAVMNRADKALYQAKENGRNRVEFLN